MTPICHMMEVGSNGKRTWSASTALPEQKWQQVITAYDRAQKAIITSVSGISSPSVVDQCRPNSASSWAMINGIGVQVSTDLSPRCTWINSTDILQRHYLSISLNLSSTDLFNHHCYPMPFSFIVVNFVVAQLHLGIYSSSQCQEFSLYDERT